MTLPELTEALPWLGDDAEVTITLRVADLRNAVEMANGGPQVMSTRQAADVYGWSPKRWRRWAEEGLVDGAWQEEGKRGAWRLPRDGCRKRVATLLEEGRSRPGSRHGPSPVRTLDQRSRTKPHVPQERSIRRGPRAAQAG